MAKSMTPDENYLLPGIERLQSSDRPLADRLKSDVDSVVVRDLWSAYIDVMSSVDSVLEMLESTEFDSDSYSISGYSMDGEDIAPGLQDTADAVRKQFDLAGGQLNSAAKVLESGAGRHKVAEYLENVVEALAEAGGDLEYLEEVLSDIDREVARGSIDSDCREVRDLADEFSTQLESVIDAWE